MAKKKKEKEVAQERTIRHYEIVGATLKDGICNYSYELISGVGAGAVHNVKGPGLVKDDLLTAFGKLNVHLAVVDDVFKHSEVVIEDINVMHGDELSTLYMVTGFKLKGSKENLSIILIGAKHVSTVGGRIQLESPKIALDDLSSYKWHNELKAAAEEACEEVALYNEGKYTEIEPEEKEDPKQLKIDIDTNNNQEQEETADFEHAKV